MIVMQLCGGLGNQMFQYATGKALAERLGVPLALDVALCDNNKERPYRLSEFGIMPHLIRCNRITKHFHTGGVFKEKSFAYDPTILTRKDNTYLEGYWQSEKYFKPIELLIRKDFLGEHISVDPDAVSIHIRRGDYVNNSVHPVLPDSYYREATNLIKEKFGVKRIHYFSDDPEYATENSEHEDFMAMVRCRYHIIANSSFSWWAAWLCPDPDKVVIAPKRWFSDNKDTKDLIPEGWVRV